MKVFTGRYLQVFFQKWYIEVPAEGERLINISLFELIEHTGRDLSLAFQFIAKSV